MATKKAGDNFWAKIDTDYDLFGADGASNFTCDYVLDSSGVITNVANPFHEVIRYIAAPTQEATTAIAAQGATSVLVATPTSYNDGEVFMDAGGTAATATVVDTGSESLTVTALESLGDAGNIDVEITDTGAVSGNSCSCVWNDSGDKITCDVDFGTTDSSAVQTELLTFDGQTAGKPAIIDTVTGGGVGTWAGTILQSTSLTTGADPEIYYIDSIDTGASNDTINLRRPLRIAIGSGANITQCGNTGVYRVMLNIATVGDYTVICSNPTIGMQNVAYPVVIIAEDLEDAHTKLDQLISTTGASRQFYRGFV